ncbi:MAG: hypothetical protein U0838_02305 [Chloroflexota bacterium]
MRAILRGLTAAAAVLLAVAACGPSVPPSIAGATPGPATGAATRHVDVPGFAAFDLPPAWLTASFDKQAVEHATVLAYFSTEALSQPCSRIPATSNCPEYPVERLNANGVLVTWTAFGLGGEAIDWSKGAPVTAGGQAGRLTTQDAGEACNAIIGEREMIVRIRGAQGPQYTEMDACYLGPDLDKTEKQLRAMLASAIWH